MTADLALELSHVTKRFPHAGSDAVHDLSLEVPTGELVVLVGPSGCGKTTTLRMLNRLEEPTAGEIRVGGVDIRSLPPHELRRGMGYVIQGVGLFPHRTIAQNIATVPKLLGWDRRRIDDRVHDLVELVDLDPSLLRRYPNQLSGGQQQRVGVARALAADPPVLLMDEPYSAVDPIVRARLQDDLLALHRRLGTTIVLVTHDIDEAVKLGDRIAVLAVGGVLAQYATPDDLLAHPVDDFVREFLGGQRGLRRLAIVEVGDLPLGAPGTDGAPRIDARSGAHDALDLLLSTGAPTLDVVRDGDVVGSVSVDIVGRALRARVGD